MIKRHIYQTIAHNSLFYIDYYYDDNGTLVAEYRYDAYGKPVKILDGNGNDVSTNYAHIANINPIRYRGYYYDIETGFYYLQSRYYDPEIGRFINADSQLNTNNILGFNAFAYCYNNPVMYIDYNGYDPQYFASEEAALRDFAATYYRGNNDFNASTEIEYICLIEEVEIECISECYAMVQKQFLWWKWKTVKYSKKVYKAKAYTYTVQEGIINGGTVQWSADQNIVAMAHTHPNYVYDSYYLIASLDDYSVFKTMDDFYGRNLTYYICMQDGNTRTYSSLSDKHIYILPDTNAVCPAYERWH